MVSELVRAQLSQIRYHGDHHSAGGEGERQRAVQLSDADIVQLHDMGDQDGGNYGCQGIWDAIKPVAGVTVEVRKDKTVRAYIFQAIPKDILLQITMKKTSKDAWDSMKTRYLGADRVKKARLQTLMSELVALRMTEGESINEFASKLSGMVTKFRSLGDTLDDATLVKKLLDSVLDKFLQLVDSIEQSYDLDVMLFGEAIGRLKA